MGSAFLAIASSKCVLGLGEVAKHHENESAERQSSPIGYFFRAVWQTQPALYRSSGSKGTENDPGESSPMAQALGMTWDDVADLCHHCRHHHAPIGNSPPLFFRDGTPITDPDALYASNPHAAYLDGASVVVNHADFHHPKIARLCEDLQQTFPHVYANAYLTPAKSHAVEAHADDRDVLVVQVLGRKKWKVYKRVPVAFPFGNEQVGKNGKEVDSAVFGGGLCFGDKEVVLCPGDVLYLPRGYVHEATTEDFDDDASGCAPSLHVTIAIATHDWCLSVLLSETIRQTLDEVADFRRALPIGPCKEYEDSFADECEASRGSSYLKRQLDKAVLAIQSKVTPSLLEQQLRAKYSMHNAVAHKNRQKLPMTQQSKKRKHPGEPEEYVGYNAASRLTLQSLVRVSTPEERSSVVMTEGRLRGLTVREETMAFLMEILQKLKGDPALRAKVQDLRDLARTGDDKMDIQNEGPGLSLVCDFTLLSFARCCVELGALAVLPTSNN